MRKGFQLLPLLLVFLVASGCGKKQEIEKLQAELQLKSDQIVQLEQQVGHLQATNNSLLDRMSDLSIVSKTGAESIKQSLESLSDQYDFIQDLTTKVQSKDSLNLALVLNLKRSLSDINDEDVQVEVRGGKVHVSISDKMLFASGSTRLGNRAEEVLNKIASVINDHSELDVMIEGHTDNVPIENNRVEDNWDLSVLRATAVARMLEEDYYVDPTRLTAAGRSFYAPIADNNSSSGRAANRRTEIVIMPQLDQFFQLLEAPALAD